MKPVHPRSVESSIAALTCVDASSPRPIAENVGNPDQAKAVDRRVRRPPPNPRSR